MDVYLVRHAIAYDRNSTRWPNDALRPLTAVGKRKFRKAAGGLARLIPKSALVLTSPYVRARETADILVAVARLHKPVEAAELASGKAAREAFALLRARRRKSIVMVGHEPNLSTWMSAALARERARLDIEFRKGGAACLRFEGAIAPGRGKLIWMLPPGALRAMR
jgi:phosphohistidine phosphatase